MQHLKVSGAVRPLKWFLGVKWLRPLYIHLPGTPRILHDSPFYLVLPDVFSLVGEVLSADDLVHRNTYNFSYFFYLLIYLFIYY